MRIDGTSMGSVNEEDEDTRDIAIESFPTVYLPRTWNSIPLEIKSLGTLTSFKTSFLEEYSNFHCINRNCFSC